MNIGIVGLGSMGNRRIRLIKQHDESIKMVGIDSREDRRKKCELEWGILTYLDLYEAITSNQLDCVFVCTSPLTHRDIIQTCLHEGLHVFSELNLVADGYDLSIALAKEKNLVLFLSSTFLYRNEVQYIKKAVRQSATLLNYSYHVGQYLPDWHPWENYLNYFVAENRSNGCREIFAIEFPWLVDVFGPIDQVEVIKNKISDLQIDYPDNYLLVIQHKHGHKGMLAVDIVSRKPVRNLEIFGEALHLTWDGSPNGLRRYDYEAKVDRMINSYEVIDQLDSYSQFVVENAYFNEIVSFFRAINYGERPLYSFEQDLEILSLIDRIEA
nr:Gfo/Idh/MocA family oxidoreductase [Bacilli bacterium]